MDLDKSCQRDRISFILERRISEGAFVRLNHIFHICRTWIKYPTQNTDEAVGNSQDDIYDKLLILNLGSPSS